MTNERIKLTDWLTLNKEIIKKNKKKTLNELERKHWHFFLALYVTTFGKAPSLKCCFLIRIYVLLNFSLSKILHKIFMPDVINYNYVN